MSLKAKAHINTTCKMWVITPHGGSQEFGILMLIYEMNSPPQADHLPPLPCLLSHINWLLHLTILTLTQSLALPPLPDHVFHIPSLPFHTPPHDLHDLPFLHFHTDLAWSQFTILRFTQ
ncbi:hypothetical protein O181_015122 [Austropuccinia psidii MF-1]|uniref:Uncharacterized protein n=1 Tax=Austropuccinia psidii MF-1 TaxID=1389203 RepID=A0A9Q3GQH1_9BASI|nr:hypothetical protein [Austropuccinia psidii MF-1]